MKLISIFLLLFTFLMFPRVTFASSSYVLPYPPQMPGSTFYKLRIVEEFINKYWYFGNISQFKYNLELSDKYLVQAKTLFEYKQYLLAYDSLLQSDNFFKEAKFYLIKAEKEEKNISEKRSLISKSAEKHIEMLDFLRQEVPFEFEWTPEKTNATNLKLHDEIDVSISLRKQAL